MKSTKEQEDLAVQNVRAMLSKYKELKENLRTKLELKLAETSDEDVNSPQQTKEEQQVSGALDQIESRLHEDQENRQKAESTSMGWQQFAAQPP